MYKSGDTVMYASHGVCKVEGVETHDFSGDAANYYVLRPVFDTRSTVFVPTANEELCSRMRYVHTVSEIEAMLSSVPAEKLEWIKKEPDRKRIFSEIISKGDTDIIISLIVTIHAHKESVEATGKRLHISDARTLADAERMLADEIAYSKSIPREEAVVYIRDALTAVHR